MSRIGKQPVVYPKDVKVTVDEGKRLIQVEGPGNKKLDMTYHARVDLMHDAEQRSIEVKRRDDERQSRALHGLTRTLINNMIIGVTQGYQKKLKVEGIGYQARMSGKKVVLVVGFANHIEKEPPPGVEVKLEDANTILVSGIDKQQVGQFAAEIRAARKPEPYKGKGIRYDDEVIRRKEGKAVGG
ncbi:MAG: 50S ribosomal protein L6 [Gemmataceae bacterium]